MEEAGYQVDGLNRTLLVVIPATQSSEKLEEYLREISRNAQIKGFRPGKAPLKMIQNLYGRHAASKILDDLIKESAQAAMKERNDDVLSQPEIVLPDKAVETVLAKQDLKFSIKYEVSPEINIGDLSEIELERPIVSVSEENVESYLENLAEQNRVFESREAGSASENGDQLDLSLVRKGADSSATASESERIKLELGSSGLFGEEEKKLVGTKVGDIRELSISDPNSEGSDQDGEAKLHFSVTVLGVSKPVKVKIDEEFAKSLGMESLEQLKEQVRSSGNKQTEELANTYLTMQVQDKLLNWLEFPISEKMMEAEVEKHWEEFKAQKQNESKADTDADNSEQADKDRIKRQVENQLKLFHIVQAFATKFEIQATEQEINAKLEDFLKSAGGQIDSANLSSLRENKNLMAQIEIAAVQRKVEEYVVENAKTTNKTMSEDELVEAINNYKEKLESVELRPEQSASA